MILVKRVSDDSERDCAYSIRREVFVVGQGVPEEVEQDEHDASCDHVLVFSDDEPVGTGRLRVVDGKAKLERICVLASHRRLGLGKHIVRKLEELALEKNLSEAKLNAQVHAQAFYEKLGYRQTSEPFMEENIPHIAMLKNMVGRHT